MALIKCSECGKEFSNKASACPNCACPIIKEKVKNMKKKKWEELSNQERINIVSYRKSTNQWWEIFRIFRLVFTIIGLVLVFIYFLSFNWRVLFCAFLSIGINCFVTFICLKEDQAWYEQHIEELYEKKIIK